MKPYRQYCNNTCRDLMAHILIPKEIAAEEPCIRCIKPDKMKKTRILPDAMFPREGSCDASLLRLNYTTLDFCVQHGKSLDSNSCLGGLVKFSQSLVDSVNQWATTDDSEVVDDRTKEKAPCGICAHVEYSPVDNGGYVDKNQNYYTDSPITHPMHADLMFHEPLEHGLVRIRMRKYANQLIKLAHKVIMTDGVLGEWVV